MQVNKFIAYINSDEHLLEASEQELLPLVKNFPYCQTGQLMYAIHLHANASISFDEQLKKAAAYAGEREKLFQLIHHKNLVEASELEQESESKQELPSDTEELIKTDKEEISPGENVTEIVVDEDLAALEKEYLTQAINSSILLEADEEAKQLDQEEGLPSEEVQEVNLFDENQEHSFGDWLKHFNGESVEPGQERTGKKKSNLALIDKFIQEDPRIEPKKTSFYSPSSMARKSVTDEGFVSETLALIHMDQGNYEEAIRTYEKLILNNPKKRSYFASQIKILKQKLKQ